VLRIALDDLHVDAEASAAWDDLGLEALVDQSLSDGAAGVLSNHVQQGDACDVVVDVRGEDDDCDDRPRTSTARPRLRPDTRLTQSWPVVAAGTEAAARTLCVSAFVHSPRPTQADPSPEPQESAPSTHTIRRYDATSETLLIHRNIVRFRLQRIREITGHDLSEVETPLDLHIATSVRNVLDAPGPSRPSLSTAWPPWRLGRASPVRTRVAVRRHDRCAARLAPPGRGRLLPDTLRQRCPDRRHGINCPAMSTGEACIGAGIPALRSPKEGTGRPRLAAVPCCTGAPPGLRTLPVHQGPKPPPRTAR
jgi:hypothetical protein